MNKEKKTITITIQDKAIIVDASNCENDFEVIALLELGKHYFLMGLLQEEKQGNI